MNKKSFRLKVFEKASYCRHFEEQVVKNIKSKNINIPTYISAGQEFIPATIATICEMIKVGPYYLANIVVIRFTWLLEEIKKN